MFRSLRSRLWLSYAALIVIALSIVAFVLFLFLLRDSRLYRTTFAQLAAAQAPLVTAAEQGGQLQPVAGAFGVRAVVFSSLGQVVQDTGANQGSIRLPRNPLNLRSAGTERDPGGRFWLYSVKRLSDGNWLLVASPRPKVIPLLALFTDEVSTPFLEGGLIALILSLVLAFVVARWVGDPLERIVAAARTMPSESMQPLPERGPHEVRELTRAFNAMVNRVRASRTSQRDFVANVSHELKTPLTSIQGFAQALMDGTAHDPEQQRQAAEVIYNEAGRMHRMALDLLELARLDSGTADFKQGSVDIPALLRSTYDRFQPMAQAAGVSLQLAETPSLPAVRGDGDRLAQVFGNLVDNAVKFTPRGGAVTVRAMQLRGEIQVSVTDTGQGIPPTALPHIFDRFYRADAARAAGDGHGAGLGLAIVHEVVAAHGGRISVRSAEGRGTGFVVHLPLPRDL